MITAHQAEQAVEAQLAREPFAGVVSLSTPDTILLRRAFGLADRANARPNTVDTRFGIASGTKTITAVATAALVDDGRLAFDTRLADVVSTPLPHHDPAITIAHLLSHTAGNPDYFDEETDDDYAALWADRPTHTMRSPSDFLPMFADLPQKFPPGERFAYSNAGYLLLGLAIEAASGMPYPEYVASRVLEPAGMTDTGFFALDELPDRVALGYLEAEPADGSGPASNRTNLFSIPIVGGPDGGLNTTAPDLESFWRALLSGRLLTPDTTTALLTPQARPGPDQPTEAYGYGVWIAEANPDHPGTGRRYVMLGEDPGASMASTVDQTSGLVLTVLANSTTAAWGMESALRQAVESAD